MSELYIGVMSGTSLDGVDISLCEFNDKSAIRLEHFHSFAFDEELKQDIINAINGKVTLKEIGIIDEKLGKMYARHINEFIKIYNLSPKDIKAIGLHGQTVWHEPNYSFSMQIGNPNKVAYDTGIAVVCDIRRKDMASGGQGAPFAPAFHSFLFGSDNAAVVNIGGMANISILGDKVIGYDTGCGNVLLDGWIEKYQSKSYDENGEWSRSGELDKALLEDFLSDEYFTKDYPKSTGREYFNMAWIEDKLLCRPEFSSGSKDNEILKQVQHDSVLHNNEEFQADIQRTLLELTAKSITNETNKFDIKRVVICGGGVKNIFLMERLRKLSKCEVFISDELGVSSDAMESMMMAWLAFMRIQKRVVPLKDVTGATRNLILGGLYEPN